MFSLLVIKSVSDEHYYDYPTPTESAPVVIEGHLNHEASINNDKGALRNTFFNHLRGNSQAADWAINELYSKKEVAVHHMHKSTVKTGDLTIRYIVDYYYIEAFIEEDGSVNGRFGFGTTYSDVCSYYIHHEVRKHHFHSPTHYYYHIFLPYAKGNELFNKLISHSNMRISEQILYRNSRYTNMPIVPKIFIS